MAHADVVEAWLRALARLDDEPDRWTGPRSYGSLTHERVLCDLLQVLAADTTPGPLLRMRLGFCASHFVGTCNGRTMPAWTVEDHPRLAALAGVACRHLLGRGLLKGVWIRFEDGEFRFRLRDRDQGVWLKFGGHVADAVRNGRDGPRPFTWLYREGSVPLVRGRGIVDRDLGAVLEKRGTLVVRHVDSPRALTALLDFLTRRPRHVLVCKPEAMACVRAVLGTAEQADDDCRLAVRMLLDDSPVESILPPEFCG